jgi:undecaprenyl diphosphate synthase
MAWAKESQIEEVILYAFSLENWNRSEEEVGYLMDLFEHAFGKWMQELIAEGVRVRFIGDRSLASERIQKIIAETEEKSVAGIRTLTIAFSYGGRQEIVAAANKLLSEGRTAVTEGEFKQAMWSGDCIDPDLIIRTSGEQRLSNFLPWQGVYSELCFTETKWPAFTKEEFFSILEEFQSRDRRMGK